MTALSAAEIFVRCVMFVSRLEDQALERGRGLFTIWNSFNHADNPMRAHPLGDGKNVALNLMAEACLHETILILCAAMDDLKPGQAFEKSDRCSFPVVRRMMETPGVFQRACTGGGSAAAFARFQAGVDALLQGDDLRSVRNFRDDYLGHNLSRVVGNLLPKMDAITRLMEQVCILSGDCQLALFGRRREWNGQLVSVQDSISAVWRVLAR